MQVEKMSFVTVFRHEGAVDESVVEERFTLMLHLYVVVDVDFEGVEHFLVVREEDRRSEIGRSQRCYWCELWKV